MKAFHNDKKIKSNYLKRVRDHALADEIVKGRYWQDGKGCAVGCTVHSDNHAAYETELGIPCLLAHLEDGVFEGLPNKEAQKWPTQFLAAIKLGADLSNVWPEFAVWMLTDPRYGVLQFAKTDGQREAIQSVADLYVLKSEGADIDINDWIEARNTATAYAADATAYTAYAAAYAADATAYTAYAAAYAADAAAYTAYAAAYAAYAAAYAADATAYAYDSREDKRQEWRVAQSKKLLELLKAAK